MDRAERSEELLSKELARLAQTGDIAGAERLLHDRPVPADHDPGGDGSPLMVSVRRKDARFLQFLLDRGASPDRSTGYVNGWKRGPFRLACELGQERLAWMIREAGYIPTPDDWDEALLDAASAPYPDLFFLALDRGANPAASWGDENPFVRHTALSLALKHYDTNPEVVLELIRRLHESRSMTPTDEALVRDLVPPAGGHSVHRAGPKPTARASVVRDDEIPPGRRLPWDLYRMAGWGMTMSFALVTVALIWLARSSGFDPGLWIVCAGAAFASAQLLRQMLEHDADERAFLRRQELGSLRW